VQFVDRVAASDLGEGEELVRHLAVAVRLFDAQQKV
jgi:hypothetical protein